jgi:hypothetical protein
MPEAVAAALTGPAYELRRVVNTARNQWHFELVQDGVPYRCAVFHSAGRAGWVFCASDGLRYPDDDVCPHGFDGATYERINRDLRKVAKPS